MKKTIFRFTQKLIPWVLLAGIALVVIWLFYFSPPDETHPEFALTKFVRWRKLAICVGWVTLLFAWLAHLRTWVSGILLCLIFFMSAFFAFVGFEFKLPYSYGLMADIAQTHWQEAVGFISVPAVLAVIGFVAAMFALAFLLRKIRPTFPSRKVIVWGVPVILVCSIIISCVKPDSSPAPVRRVVMPLRDFLVLKKDMAWIRILEELEAAENNSYRIPGAEKSSPIVFFHLGESVRADHAPFNGYARNTMPRMQKEFENGNLISFPKCVSFDKHTRNCVLGIFTPATVLDTTIRHGGFVSVLNRNKIKSCGFFSRMRSPNGKDKNDTPLMQMTKNLNEKIYSEKQSDTLLLPVRERLCIADDENFFFYYGEGAHTPATFFNREKYDIFKPSAKFASDSDERRVNAYDNCIVAVDDFCGNAIDALRDKNAVYIYVSDHGEMLGEDGFWVRPKECFRRKETRHVLFFIWCSEKFKRENPEKYRVLVENSKRLGIVSHDFIYHTVLSFYGIRTPYYDARCDLLSPDAVPFPQELPDNEEFGPLRFENAAIRWQGTPDDRVAGEKRLREREARRAKKSAEN